VSDLGKRVARRTAEQDSATDLQSLCSAMLSHHHLHHQPPGCSDCSKNDPAAIFKLLPLPQTPKKRCSGGYRLVLKQKLREVKMARGTTLHNVLQIPGCKHSSRTQRSSLLKTTAHTQS